MKSALTRRCFLQLGSLSLAVLPRYVGFSQESINANDRISVGWIGTGGRGSDLMTSFLAVADKQNARITAVCDVWKKNRQNAVKRIQDQWGAEPHQFTRYSELLANGGVDAVVIATPDFSHAPILLAALEAGKDVYIEKPMSIDLGLATKALELARLKKRIVQVGTQYRSDGRYRGAVHRVSEIGKLNRISVAVNFNEARWARDVSDCEEGDVDWEAFLLSLPKRPFDARLLRRWQLYRETTNGMSGLWMSHYADLTHMLTGSRYPASAVALGGTYVWQDGREHTDTFHALLEYPEGFILDWSMGLGNSAGSHFNLYGTRGTMDLINWTISNEGSTDKSIQSEPIKSEPGMSHMENWLECMRTRRRPNADIEFGHQHVVATIMAATALQTGQRQKYRAETKTIQPG